MKPSIVPLAGLASDLKNALLLCCVGGYVADGDTVSNLRRKKMERSGPAPTAFLQADWPA